MSGAGGGCVDVEGLIENLKSGSVAEYTNNSLAGSTQWPPAGPEHTLQWGHDFYTTQASLCHDDRVWDKLHPCYIVNMISTL